MNKENLEMIERGIQKYEKDCRIITAMIRDLQLKKNQMCEEITSLKRMFKKQKLEN